MSQHSSLVGVILPTLSNAQFGLIARGIGEALAVQKHELFLGVTEYLQAREERLIEELLQRRAAAVVLTGAQRTERSTSLLRKAGLPVVEFFDAPAVPVEHVVAFDHAAAGRAVVQHLFERNHSRLAVIAPMDGLDRRAERRAMGVAAAALEFGLPPVTLLRNGTARASMDQGVAGAADVVQNHPYIDAIVCMNDYAALGAINECRRRRVRVPDAIAVTGFGDAEFSAHVFPSITTVGFDPLGLGYDIGTLALSALESARAGRRREPHYSHSAFEIVARESA